MNGSAVSQNNMKISPSLRLSLSFSLFLFFSPSTILLCIEYIAMNSNENDEVKNTTEMPFLFSSLTIIFNGRETKRRINGPTAEYGLCSNDWAKRSYIDLSQINVWILKYVHDFEYFLFFLDRKLLNSLIFDRFNEIKQKSSMISLK